MRWRVPLAFVLVAWAAALPAVGASSWIPFPTEYTNFEDEVDDVVYSTSYEMYQDVGSPAFQSYLPDVWLVVFESDAAAREALVGVQIFDYGITYDFGIEMYCGNLSERSYDHLSVRSVDGVWGGSLTTVRGLLSVELPITAADVSVFEDVGTWFQFRARFPVIDQGLEGPIWGASYRESLSYQQQGLYEVDYVNPGYFAPVPPGVTDGWPAWAWYVLGAGLAALGVAGAVLIYYNPTAEFCNNAPGSRRCKYINRRLGQAGEAPGP